MTPSPHPETRIKRILFCTDFSDSAAAAFELALDAAVHRPGCTLYLLHVVHEVEAQFWKSYIYEVDNVDDQARRAMDQKFTQAYLSRVPPGVETKVEVRVGPDAATILEFAKEKAVDLIVIGRHGHSRMQAALFGRVVEKIVRKANCPVLVVPQAGPQARHIRASGARSARLFHASHLWL